MVYPEVNKGEVSQSDLTSLILPRWSLVSGKFSSLRLHVLIVGSWLGFYDHIVSFSTLSVYYVFSSTIPSF